MKCNYCFYFLLTVVSFFNFGSLSAEELPVRLQVALMSKVFTMESNLAQKQKISIYVLDAPKIYKLLVQDVGFKVGQSTLEKVDFGGELPKEKYDVIYIGSFAKEALAVAYAAKNKTLSIYPVIKGMKSKGALGLGIKSGKPTFVLNRQQSIAENLLWHKRVLQVAQILPPEPTR